jgi:hypothetical protein
MAPLPEFGHPFHAKSDLDLAIIAEPLFNRAREDFSRWQADVQDGRLEPRTSAQARFWPDSLERLPGNILSGFVDPYKIPSLPRYSTVRYLRQTEWLLGARIEITPGLPPISRASTRIYRDWASFLAQMERNLYGTIASFPVAK